eukprot:scaffold5660_cov323-Prasinococcus_capsulatus_cf.AAC.2
MLGAACAADLPPERQRCASAEAALAAGVRQGDGALLLQSNQQHVQAAARGRRHPAGVGCGGYQPHALAAGRGLYGPRLRARQRRQRVLAGALSSRPTSRGTLRRGAGATDKRGRRGGRRRP